MLSLSVYVCNILIYNKKRKEVGYLFFVRVLYIVYVKIVLTLKLCNPYDLTAFWINQGVVRHRSSKLISAQTLHWFSLLSKSDYSIDINNPQPFSLGMGICWFVDIVLLSIGRIVCGLSYLNV